MIPPIIWPQIPGNDLTPFEIGKNQRSLRITLHSETLSNLQGKNKEAIDAIYEFFEFDGLDLVDYKGIIIPSIIINITSDNSEYIPIEVIKPNKEIGGWHAGIYKNRITTARINSIFNLYDVNAQEFKQATKHLLCLEAHWALHRDIFITLSPYLLANRSSLDYANVRTPTEGTAIIGLLLRSRGNWVYRKVGNTTFKTNRSEFYWELMKSRLPKCLNLLISLARTKKRDLETIMSIGQSVLEKCFRIIQARDEIARQFYLPQDNNTRDLIMYHFDYLTLLLSGAFDAEAAIANLLYGFGIKDRYASFRNEKIIDALKKSHARQLYNEITSPRCVQLKVMLDRLRNTIHTAGVSTFAEIPFSGSEVTFAKIPETFRDELEKSAILLGGINKWGLRHHDFLLHDSEKAVHTPSYEVSIEPYTYASCLIDEWFRLIDDIAGYILEDQLLPSGTESSPISVSPEDLLHVIDRFSVLST